MGGKLSGTHMPMSKMADFKSHSSRGSCVSGVTVIEMNGKFIR